MLHVGCVIMKLIDKTFNDFDVERLKEFNNNKGHYGEDERVIPITK